MSLNSRDAALIAEQAWDAVKEDSDPKFSLCQPDHQGKLLTVVRAVVETPHIGAQIQGLEAFEEKVRALLAPLPAVVVHELVDNEPEETVIDIDIEESEEN